MSLQKWLQNDIMRLFITKFSVQENMEFWKILGPKKVGKQYIILWRKLIIYTALFGFLGWPNESGWNMLKGNYSKKEETIK
jgi:hypothetical protein